MNHRDKMLIEAGIMAADLYTIKAIDYPLLDLDEDNSFVRFIVDAVADYIMSGSKDNFTYYIHDVLVDEYGVTRNGV